MLDKYPKYKKLLYCGILLIIFILITIIIKYYFKPFIIIVILLYLCTPIYNMLSNYKFFSPKSNAFLSLLIVNLLLFIAIVLIGNFMYNSIINFLKDFSSYTSTFEKSLENISKVTKINLSDLNGDIKNFYSNLVNSGNIKKGAVYTTNGLLAYLIGNIAAYFILSDKKSIIDLAKYYIPCRNIQFIQSKYYDINKVVKIEINLIIITTIETILGFMALGIKNAFALGLICGILDILPFVGTILVFLPLIVYKILTKEYIISIGLLLLYILLNISRQIFETKFMSNKLQIHPLIIIIALYIGIKLFGIIGLFVGPLYAIVAREILNN